MRYVWPYFAPPLTALYLGNQNPPKNLIWGYMTLYALDWLLDTGIDCVTVQQSISVSNNQSGPGYLVHD
jgi:hypothetical protein